MPRPEQIPHCPGIPEIRSSRHETQEYLIRLLTPMFGGGVKAGEPDQSLPIRGTSIRGQLQHWWRATQGVMFKTGPELHNAQTEVWGSTDRASPVEVEVRNVRADQPLACAAYSPRNDGRLQMNWREPFGNSVLPYALFPFQGQLSNDRRRIEKEPATFIRNAEFTLRVRFPKACQADVESSVWAWVNFGGLGARTRRGCGALFCEQLAPKDVGQLSAWLTATGLPIEAIREWPTLPKSILIRPEDGDPLSVWDWLIGLYRYFRQGEEFARNPGPGRSLYPEPETIRRITGQRWTKHEAWDDMPDGFPRAELGLPIVFHFKDENRGEPSRTTLNPYVDGAALERMASPLILKPLALANRKAVPLILPLTTTGVQQVELQDEHKNCLTPRHAVPVRDATLSQSCRPLQGLSNSGSALEAFLNFARQQNGCEEYTR